MGAVERAAEAAGGSAPVGSAGPDDTERTDSTYFTGPAAAPPHRLRGRDDASTDDAAWEGAS